MMYDKTIEVIFSQNHSVMNNMKKRIQIALAVVGLITSLSMCGSDEPVSTSISFPAMVLVLMSGALLLNLRNSGQQ